MDVMQLFATMMTSVRLRQLVSGDGVAWRLAGSACLPLSWQAVTMPGARFDVLSMEAKLFLKYVVLHERCCAQALVSPDFRPFCLRATGVSLSVLSRSLPSARFFSTTSSSSTDPSHPPSPSTTTTTTTSTISTTDSQLQSAANTSLAPNAPPTPEPALSASRLELVYPHVSHRTEPLSFNAPQAQGAQTGEERGEDEPALDAGGGEVPNVDIPGFFMSDAVPSAKKPHGVLRRSLSKLKHVAHLFHKPSKSSSSGDGQGSFSKRLVKYDSPQVDDVLSGEPKSSITVASVVEGVDKAWFGLADPKSLCIPGLASSRWRVMSEENLLVSVMSVYRFNPRVISVGAYIVRRLCYLEPPSLLHNLHSIRARLSSTSIVDALLQALEEYQKECTLASAILVALGNLALTSVSARAIGERGLPLVVRVMKRHHSVPRVVDYGIFLLLNVCDGQQEFKRKLRDLDFPELAVKQIAKFIRPLRPNGKFVPTAAPTSTAPATASQAPPAPRKDQKAFDSSITIASTTLNEVSASLVSAGAKGQVLTSLKPVLDSYRFQPPRSQLALSSSYDQRSLTDSIPYIVGCGGSEAGVTDSTTSEGEDSFDVTSGDMDLEEEVKEEVWRRQTRDIEEADERASRWILKRRPTLSFVQSVLHNEHRLSELAMIRKYLDVLCVLGSDYDMLKPDLAVKCATLIGDLIIMLYGIPLPHVDSLLVAAFRCLLVIFEWGVLNQDSAYCGPFLFSLIFFSETFIKSHIMVPYMINCYLIIFSLLWKRWDHTRERRRFVDILIATLKLEALRRPPSMLNAMTSSSSSGHTRAAESRTRKTSSSSVPSLASPSSSPIPTSTSASSSLSSSTATTSPTSAPQTQLLLITCAAMLGDFAHASYEMRSHIRDSGVLQLLRLYRDEAQGTTLDKLNDSLDEFEDNPLLRRGARARRRRQEEDDEQGERDDGDDDNGEEAEGGQEEAIAEHEQEEVVEAHAPRRRRRRRRRAEGDDSEADAAV